MARVETKKRIWTLGELEQAHIGDIALAENGGMSFDGRQLDLSFPGRLDVHIATTQPKKIEEFNGPLSCEARNVGLSSAVGSLGWWLCDPEESGTYVGNAAGKILSIIDRIYNHHAFGYYRFAEDLKGKGINPENLLYVVNDTGYSLLRDYRFEQEFVKSVHKAGPVGWPGPELGPILDAHTGVIGFYADLKRMVQRKMAEGEKDVCLDGHDEVTYMFFRPVPNPDDIKVYSFAARVPMTFQLEPPKGYNGEVLTSLHFMKFRGDDVPEDLKNKSVAEVRDEYIRRHGPMAHALRQFFSAIDAPKSLLNVFGHSADNKKRTYRISTQNNLMDAALIPGTGVPFRLTKSMAVSTLRFDHLEANSLHHMTEGSDAVVLQPHSPAVLKNWRKNFLPMMDLYCSLVVKNQVCVETMSGRPLVILQRQDNKFYYDGFTNGQLDWDDPKTERAFLRYLDGINPVTDPWLVPMMLTRYLHEKNAVKQEEHHLFTQVEPDDPHIAKIIEKKILNGLPQRIEEPEYERETFGLDKRGMFEVFIAGSAGTHAEDYIEAAETLGYWCAAQGFHVRTGGGNYGVMGAVARGVQRFMKDYPERSDQTYLSLIQTFRTIQFEGAAIKPDKIKDMPNVYMSIEKTFDDRMKSLFRVRGRDAQDASIGTANVVMFGGIGTVQEATRWMRYKESGVAHMKDQKMIFFNQKQAGDVTGRQIRAMDAFMHAYPPEIRRAHISVRPDIESVKRAIIERYRNWAQKYRPDLVAGQGGPSAGLHL